MAWFTRSSRYFILAAALALMLGLAVNVSAQVPPQSNLSSLSRKLVNAFTPPQGPVGPAPINREGGATRGPCLANDGKRIVALVPAAKPGETVGMGITAAENPTIFWYMPQIIPEDAEAPAVEFTLKDVNDQDVYSATYRLTKSATGVVGAPGIMSLKIANLYPLEVGKEYHWQLALMCDATGPDRSQDVYVDGRIMRVAPNPNLAKRVQQASLQDRVALYADEKLWYETLDALVELRREQPNDQYLADAWDKLLSLNGLNEISKEPLLQSARNISN